MGMMRIAGAVTNNPKKTIALLIGISILFGLLLPRVNFEAEMQDMVPGGDPVIQDLEEATEVFGSQDVVMVVVKSDNIFELGTLKKIDELSRELSELDGVEGVTSPLNIDLIESSDVLIEISPIVDRVPQDADEAEEFKERLLGSRMGESLVTEEGGAALILVTVEPNITGTTRANRLTEEMLAIVEENQGPESIYVVGDAVFGHYSMNSMNRDLLFLLPLVSLVVIVVLYLSFRSVKGFVLPLLTVALSIVWMIGFMGLVGFPFSIVSIVAPIIMVAIGSAYGIHIVNRYYEAAESGMRGKEAVVSTMQDMNAPVTMTALTTAAGFVSLATSFVIPIRQFGIATAFGVLSAMILSLTFIPAVLTLQQIPKHIQKRKGSRVSLSFFLGKSGRYVADHPRLVTLVACCVLAFFLVGALRISTEADFTRYLGEDNPAVVGMRVVEEEFGGSSRLSVVVDTGEEDGIKEPGILKEMVRLQEYLDSLEYVSDPSSLTDLVMELNQVLQGGDPAEYRIPDTRQAVAQELLLFTMQGGSGIDSMVSYNFEKALVSAQVENVGGPATREIVDRIDRDLDEEFNSEGFQSKLVGLPKVMIRLMDRILDSQIWSLFLSIGVVGFIVSLLFRSIRIGFICAVPLLFTVGMNFGVMGYLGIPLDVATAMIASIAIGIGVDYSIHFVSRYRKEMRGTQDRSEALVTATKTTGRGISFNAITLTLGFGVLLFSSFYFMTVFGLLLALTMLISSLAALTLIPAILRMTGVGSK